MFAYARSMEEAHARAEEACLRRRRGLILTAAIALPAQTGQEGEELAERGSRRKRARRKEERRWKKNSSNTDEQSQTGRRWARRPCSKQSCNSALAPREESMPRIQLSSRNKLLEGKPLSEASILVSAQRACRCTRGRCLCKTFRCNCFSWD